jgi:UPF0755 protein
MKKRSKRTLQQIAVAIVVLTSVIFIAIAVSPKVSKDADNIIVVVPAGLASPDIARVIKRSIPSFDTREFAALAKPYEGYLFPDTYSFTATTTPQEAVDAMRKNFDARTGWLLTFNTLKNRSVGDVVKVASLVEEEASSYMDRRIISGIIWKRLDRGMPLQLDAPFFYVLGKFSHELTYNDLAMDSPYNLYRNKGLPPTPIDNPSLGSIKAALNPIKTSYLYFLSDNDGMIYFSETYEEHMAKRGKYID